jgi:hypothetical protein
MAKTAMPFRWPSSATVSQPQDMLPTAATALRRALKRGPEICRTDARSVIRHLAAEPRNLFQKHFFVVVFCV